MASNDQIFANSGEIKNAVPSIYKVSGAAALDIMLVLAFGFVLMVAASAIWALNEFVSHSGHMPNTQPGQMALMLISIPTLYLAILALWAWRGRRNVLTRSALSTSRLIAYGIGGGFVLFVLTMLTTFALNAAGAALKPTNQALIETLSKQWPITITIFAVIVAPIFEELFFRKQLFARFASAGYLITGYAVSSVFFALMHEPFPTQGVARWLLMLAIYSFMGVVLATVYRKTGRLWPVMLAHASNNIFAMSVLFISS